MHFFRMIALLLVIEMVLYVILSAYVRSVRREALENAWKAKHPEIAQDRKAMSEAVERSMRGYSKTLRARLVNLVFVVPTIIVLAIIYIVNA